jgi:hypothetical protein
MSKIQDFIGVYSSSIETRRNIEIQKKATYQAAQAQTYTITDTNTSGWPLESGYETVGKLLRYIFPSAEGVLNQSDLMGSYRLPPAIFPGGGSTPNPAYFNVMAVLTGNESTATTKEVYNKLKDTYRANYFLKNYDLAKDFGGQNWFDKFMISALSYMTRENINISDVDLDLFDEYLDDFKEKFKREYFLTSNVFPGSVSETKVLYDAFIEAGPNYVQPNASAGTVIGTTPSNTGTTTGTTPSNTGTVTGTTPSNTVPVTVPPVASQVVTPTSSPAPVTTAPPPGKLYNSIVFNVEKTNILVPTQNTFDLGELTIVKRDYTPPVPVTDNTPLTNIGEFSDMAPTDVPPTAPSGKSSPSGFTIKGSSFRVANRQPTQIVIHYTAGWQITDKNKATVDFLQSRLEGSGLTYHFIIAVDGHIENLVDPKNVAFHAKGANSNTIGISLASLGTTYHSKNTLASADEKVNSYRTKNDLYKLAENHAELVDFNEKKAAYRGNIKFSQEVSDAQLRSLSSLLKKLRQNFPSIPAWDGLTQEKFDLMFPKSGTSYKSDKPGIYSHCSVTTGKADALPTPKFVKFLKQVRF